MRKFLKTLKHRHLSKIGWALLVTIVVLAICGINAYNNYVEHRKEVVEQTIAQLDSLENVEKQYWDSIVQIKNTVDDENLSLSQVQVDIENTKEKSIEFKNVIALNEKLRKDLSDEEQTKLDRLTESYADEVENFDIAITNLNDGIELLKRGGSCGDKFYDDMRLTLTDAVRSQVTAMTIQENLRKELKK